MEQLKRCKYCGEEPFEEVIDWYDMDGNPSSSSYRVRCPNTDCPVKPCASAVDDQSKARRIWNERMEG